jgi:16S rRNA (guanine(1405)-N(7))-methyltransferase
MPQEIPDDLIQKLSTLSKYRQLNLPESTLRDLLERELPYHRNSKEAIKEVKKKLHNIIAPYLGDPDYVNAAAEIQEAYQGGDTLEIKMACSKLLSIHASTRERLEILDDFYACLFSYTGQPQTILDLACGLNPLTIPWMGLSPTTNYYAFDIHQPRVNFLNQFFQSAGLPARAIQQDILVTPPETKADVAFLFKEAHRFEQRQKGCNRPLWQALNVRYLLVSLPPHSLSGSHDMIDRQRRLVSNTLKGLPWKMAEVMFKNEMVFVIEKEVLS